jgi:nickel/cobalt exporter
MRLVAAARPAEDSHDHLPPAEGQEHLHEHSSRGHTPHSYRPGWHSHGWGLVHTHDIEAISQARPSLGVLFALGIAGGLLPDPGALAILLAAIAKGQFILGIGIVIVFSLGFASVLVLVGVVAARVGRLILAWLSSRWIAFIQIAAALLILGIGLVLTANAWRDLSLAG